MTTKYHYQDSVSGLTPQDRKAIMDRTWTLDEADLAKLALDYLQEKGRWRDATGIPEHLTQLAQAYSTHPAGIIGQIWERIAKAYAAELVRAHEENTRLRDELQALHEGEITCISCQR